MVWCFCSFLIVNSVDFCFYLTLDKYYDVTWRGLDISRKPDRSALFRNAREVPSKIYVHEPKEWQMVLGGDQTECFIGRLQNITLNHHWTVADPGFPRERANSYGGASLLFAKFPPKKLHEMKKFWSRWGEDRTCHCRPLPFVNAQDTILNIKILSKSAIKLGRKWRRFPSYMFVFGTDKDQKEFSLSLQYNSTLKYPIDQLSNFLLPPHGHRHQVLSMWCNYNWTVLVL